MTELDHGYFGPDSITWQVNQEITVLFGGARALLMHAAHPLVAAGARQTAMYSRDPWARLIRTLQLQSTVTFGSKAEADEAADRINKLHLKVNGTDPVTNLRYDALDHELLLWVHACLEVSSIWFFERTVRQLTGAEKQRYHEENMTAAELIWLPREAIPPTYEGLEGWVDQVVGAGLLRRTDVAEDVADIIRSGPVPRGVKWMWGFISFAAFGTLPPAIRVLYGVRWSRPRQIVLDANLTLLRLVRPILPRRWRWIGPARWATERLEGRSDASLTEMMRRSAGRS
jgi:uncharacterized protein (DUF2236 family)